MSTFIDGSPPSVTPGPDGDDPVDPDTGPAWLQEEIRRRMATGRSAAGGRHARRDPAADPPGGVEHVPRHSVATPGPGAPAPGPIGGPSLPESGVPVRRSQPVASDEGWSGPAAEPVTGRRIPRAYRRGPRGPGGDAPATFGGPAFAEGAARPPAPDEFGGPGFADVRGDLDDLDDRTDVPPSTVVARGPAAGLPPGAPVTAPPVSESPVSDSPASDPPVFPAPVRPGAGPAAAAVPVSDRPVSDTPGDAPVVPPPAGAVADPEVPHRAAPTPGRGIEAGGLFDAGPDVDDRPAPAAPRPAAAAEVLPPRAPARLLAAPDVVPPPVPDAGMPTTAMPTTAMPTAGPTTTGPTTAGPTTADPASAGAAAASPAPDATRPAPPRDGTGDPALWTSDPRGVLPADRSDLTGPLTPVDDDDTVLWSAHMPPAAPDGTALATPGLPVDVPGPRSAGPGEEVTGSGLPQRRVKVVLSERRNQAHAVRTVVDIQEGGAVGELLRSNLIGSQLTVALRFALFAGLTLGLLPLAFALFPEIGRTDVLGLRLPWLLLGVLVYPFLLGLGWWHTRTAERVEQNFADHVQD